MKTKFYLLFLAFALVIVDPACTGNRKLQKGNYNSALNRSINKLRKSPGNSKAAKTLSQAYNMTVKVNMEEIYSLQNSSDIYKWEKIIERYNKLNSVYDEIVRCPGCLKVIPDPNKYTNVLTEAINNAVAVRYDLGIKAMKNNTMNSALEAYRHFSVAKSYLPDYKDIDKQMAAAKEAGTLRVVMEHIPMHSRSMQISNEFFENKIQEYLQNLNYDFVDFYTPEQARTNNIRPHQYLEFRFDDFVVGQTSIYEKETVVTRDSVILKTENTGTKEKKYTYGTVKANLHTFSKTLTSSGLLDMRIVDAANNSVLSQNKLPGTYVWETNWAYFNGDERALNKDQLQMVKQREAYPPPPQQLFIEFTKPIFSQVCEKIRNYYSGYRM